MANSLRLFSIRMANLAAMRAFCVDLLRLQEGPRPDLPFPGCWLYQGSKDPYANAVVHEVGIDPRDASALGERWLAWRFEGPGLSSGEATR